MAVSEPEIACGVVLQAADAGVVRTILEGGLEQAVRAVDIADVTAVAELVDALSERRYEMMGGVGGVFGDAGGVAVTVFDARSLGDALFLEVVPAI